jgi:hypothetical protein
LGISIEVIVILALLLEFLIQRLFIRKPIIDFNFQLILGFNLAPQPIMYGDTYFSVFTFAHRPIASIINIAS